MSSIKVLIAGSFLAASASFGLEQANSLDELLKSIKKAEIGESAVHERREQRFTDVKTQHQQLLISASAEKSSLEQKSEQLEKLFVANDLKLAVRKKQLEQRLGSMKELYGHLTAKAGDTAIAIEQSIVSAQFADRGVGINQLVNKMASGTSLPDVEEIEGLWYEIHREMTEAAKVVRFSADIIRANGERVRREVVRVGSFNLMSGGKYLMYEPISGTLSELPKQPEGVFTKSAENLQRSNTGFIATGIDPTGSRGGGLLKALIDAPTLLEKWHQGGEIGYIISAVGVLAIMVALWRLFVLFSVSQKVHRQLDNVQANNDNPLGRILLVAEQNIGLDAESLELKLHEAILKERPNIEFGINFLKIIAMVAPLGGLLGTVTGMIVVFQQITVFGAGDPNMLAGGISQALVTTVLGLIVAIPMVLMHVWVNGYAQRLLHVLEEQSAGMVAESAEVS